MNERLIKLSSVYDLQFYKIYREVDCKVARIEKNVDRMMMNITKHYASFDIDTCFYTVEEANVCVLWDSKIEGNRISFKYECLVITIGNFPNLASMTTSLQDVESDYDAVVCEVEEWYTNKCEVTECVPQKAWEWLIQTRVGITYTVMTFFKGSMLKELWGWPLPCLRNYISLSWFERHTMTTGDYRHRKWVYPLTENAILYLWCCDLGWFSTADKEYSDDLFNNFHSLYTGYKNVYEFLHHYQDTVIYLNKARELVREYPYSVMVRPGFSGPLNVSYVTTVPSLQEIDLYRNFLNEMEYLYQISYVLYQLEGDRLEQQLDSIKQSNGYGVRVEGLLLTRLGNQCSFVLIGVGKPVNGGGTQLTSEMFLGWLLREVDNSSTVEVNLPWHSGLMEIRRWKLPMLRGGIHCIFDWNYQSKLFFLGVEKEKSVLTVWRMYLHASKKCFVLHWGDNPVYLEELWNNYESVCDLVERETSWLNVYKDTYFFVEQARKMVLLNPTLLEVVCMEKHGIEEYRIMNVSGIKNSRDGIV